MKIRIYLAVLTMLIAWTLQTVTAQTVTIPSNIEGIVVTPATGSRAQFGPTGPTTPKRVTSNDDIVVNAQSFGASLELANQILKAFGGGDKDDPRQVARARKINSKATERSSAVLKKLRADFLSGEHDFADYIYLKAQELNISIDEVLKYEVEIRRQAIEVKRAEIQLKIMQIENQ